MSETEILQNLKNGDNTTQERTLRVIYKHHYAKTESMVLSNSGTKEDAKDLFQDVVIAFYNKTKNPQFTLTCKFSTFIFAMARNQWLKVLRSRKVPILEIENTFKQIPSMENIQLNLEYSENQKMLASLLKESGEKCMDLLKLFYYEKFSMKKIALLRGYSSEQIVRTQKLRCIKKLKSILMQNEQYRTNLSLREI